MATVRGVSVVLTAVSSIFLFVGCGPAAHEPQQPAPAGKLTKSPEIKPEAAKRESLIGEWVVVADTSGRGDKGHLFLNPHGLFKADYTVKTQTDRFSGTYTLRTSTEVGKSMPEVRLKIRETNGKPVKSPGELLLHFDSASGLLEDFMTVAYVRVNDPRLHTAGRGSGPNTR